MTAVAAHAQTLFDGKLGTLPEAQGWSYLGLGAMPAVVTNQSAFLDTSNATAVQAGWAEVAPVPLDRTNGFTLRFTLELDAEAHNSENRAGFSVIVLGADRRGIELGFWTNTVFAQADSPLFTHAEEARLSTGNSSVDYALTLQATHYLLRAGNALLLSGPIRDYTAFDGFPDPYETPNFLFVGDDTRSASASFALRSLALVRAPVLTTPAAGTIVWAGTSQQTYMIQISSNLTTWTGVGVVSSPDGSYRFTNNPTLPQLFFRVSAP